MFITTRYVGVYHDSDVRVMRPLNPLSNMVGLEDESSHSNLNRAVMAEINNYDNESSNDDNDDDDVGKDEEDEEDEEEEKHLASADPSTMIMSPQAENTEAFETDKSASTPPTSPYHIILSFETKSRAVRMSI
ncbi:hypothetical protein Tco_0506314 [Tanacetum coccineum]